MQLTSLQVLDVRHNPLESLPSIPNSLTRIRYEGCDRLPVEYPKTSENNRTTEEESDEMISFLRSEGEIRRCFDEVVDEEKIQDRLNDEEIEEREDVDEIAERGQKVTLEKVEEAFAPHKEEMRTWLGEVEEAVWNELDVTKDEVKEELKKVIGRFGELENKVDDQGENEARIEQKIWNDIEELVDLREKDRSALSELFVEWQLVKERLENDEEKLLEARAMTSIMWKERSTKMWREVQENKLKREPPSLLEFFFQFQVKIEEFIIGNKAGASGLLTVETAVWSSKISDLMSNAEDASEFLLLGEVVEGGAELVASIFGEIGPMVVKNLAGAALDYVEQSRAMNAVKNVSHLGLLPTVMEFALRAASMLLNCFELQLKRVIDYTSEDSKTRWQRVRQWTKRKVLKAEELSGAEKLAEFAVAEVLDWLSQPKNKRGNFDLTEVMSFAVFRLSLKKKRREGEEEKKLSWWARLMKGTLKFRPFDSSVNGLGESVKLKHIFLKPAMLDDQGRFWGKEGKTCMKKFGYCSVGNAIDKLRQLRGPSSDWQEWDKELDRAKALNSAQPPPTFNLPPNFSSQVNEAVSVAIQNELSAAKQGIRDSDSIETAKIPPKSLTSHVLAQDSRVEELEKTVQVLAAHLKVVGKDDGQRGRCKDCDECQQYSCNLLAGGACGMCGCPALKHPKQ